jgi:hypothetical protein
VLQEPVVLRKGRDVAAEAVVSAEAAQDAAAEIQAEEVLPKIARKGGHPTAVVEIGEVCEMSVNARVAQHNVSSLSDTGLPTRFWLQ